MFAAAYAAALSACMPFSGHTPACAFLPKKLIDITIFAAAELTISPMSSPSSTRAVLLFYPVVVRKARAEHTDLFREGEQDFDGSVLFAVFLEPCDSLDYLRYAGLVVRAEDCRAVRIYNSVALNGCDRRAGSDGVGVAGEQHALALAGGDSRIY